MNHTNLSGFRGFTRFMVHLASIVAGWPIMLHEMCELGFRPGDIWFRIRQEAAIARGASMADVHEMYRHKYGMR